MAESKTLTKEITAETAIQESEKNSLEIDKALNTKGFAEFLAMHPDTKTFDVGNEKEVAKRFEIFELKEEVKDSVKKLYAGEIQRDMGIELEANELGAVDKHLEKLAIENPKEILRMKERIVKFVEMPKQISELESQIAAIGKSEDLIAILEKRRKTQEELGIARKYAGVGGTARYAMMHLNVGFKALSNWEEMLSKKLNPEFDQSHHANEAVTSIANARAERAAVRSVRENIGSSSKTKIESVLASIDADIIEIENLLQAMTNLEDKKKASEKSFDSLRKKLMGGVGEIAEVKDAVQNCAKKQLLEMLNGTSIKKLNEAQSRLEDLALASETTKTGIDPLGGMDEAEYQKAVDTAIQEKAFEQIVKTVSETNLGTNALTKMEKVLRPFLTEDRLGSLDQEKTKEFITKSIQEIAENLDDTTPNKAKKIILSRIIIKMKK